MQTWTGDLANGYSSNGEVSSKVLEAAVAETKFQQFVELIPGFGRRKGESITVPLVRNIAEPTTGQLTEGIRIPIDTYAQSTVTITVAEWGRGVEFSHLSELLNYYDQEDKIQGRLRKQMALVMDTAAAAAFKTAKVIFIPTSVSGGTFDTDGTPSTAATSNLTISHVQTIRDYMADTIHVPAYSGDEYVCLASTKALRGIKQDPLFLAWRQYSDVERSHFRGEVGKIENIRFIEVNHTNALANNKGTGSVLGEALFFGEDAVGLAMAEDFELRVPIPADAGRQRSVVWYGVGQWGLLWATANDGEARCIRVTSS